MKKIIRGFFAILLLCLTVSSVSVNAATDGNGTWTNLSNDDNPLRGGRGSAMTVLNNKIYSIRKDVNVNIIEEYDPIHDKWISKTNMISKKHVGSLQAVNNKIYALCESDDANSGLIEEYNPETNKCTSKTSMLSSSNNTCIVVADNRIYIFNKVSWRLEEYNPETNKYTVKTKFDNELPSNLLLGVVNNKIYVMGGINSNKVKEYNPKTNEWTDKCQMPKSIADGEVAVVNDKIYVIGGYESTSIPHTNTVQEYNPETDKWTVKTSMASKRYWHQLAVLNNKIYAIGGFYKKDPNINNNTILNTVEEYNSETNEWTPKANMNIARTLHKALVCDNKIYVFGGSIIDAKPAGIPTPEVFSEENESKNSLNISLDKTSITLLEGETDTLTATITPKDATNKKVIWTSSDESIATVDEKGNVTAVKKGQAKITAKIDGTDVSASCDVNVTTDGDGSSKPEISSNSGILSITLVNGITKDYDLSANEITKFTKWYDASNGKGQVRYGFNKKINPYKTVKEYIVFDKIASFEIREYNAEK